MLVVGRVGIQCSKNAAFEVKIIYYEIPEVQWVVKSLLVFGIEIPRQTAETNICLSHHEARALSKIIPHKLGIGREIETTVLLHFICHLWVYVYVCLCFCTCTHAHTQGASVEIRAQLFVSQFSPSTKCPRGQIHLNSHTVPLVQERMFYDNTWQIRTCNSYDLRNGMELELMAMEMPWILHS